VCAVKGGAFLWVQGPPGAPAGSNRSGQVTKWLKPLVSGSRFGDRASVQAATRVNAEQVEGVKLLSEPDARNLHVRFDERGVETKPWSEGFLSPRASCTSCPNISPAITLHR
jgi:hypothetical protein